MQEMEDYEEVIGKLLSSLTPEQHGKLLSSLTPEQRLAGLDTGQVLLSLPDAILRDLSEETLATLSEPTRAAIRRRIGR